MQLSLNLPYLLTQINLGMEALIKFQGGTTNAAAAGGRAVGVWINKSTGLHRAAPGRQDGYG